MDNEICKVNNEDLDKSIDDNIGTVTNLIAGFSATVSELRSGIRQERELAMVIAKTVKCCLCSIANMSAIGDIDGLESLTYCAASESGCKEVVLSN